MKKNFRMIGLLGIVLGMMCMTGCGNSDEPEKKELILYEYSGYVPQSTLDAFEEEYGIRVTEVGYTSSDDMKTLMNSGQGAEYDIVQCSDADMEGFMKKNLVQKLDKNNVKNISNIDEMYMGKGADVNNDYFLPYMISRILCVVDTKTCPIEIKELNDLTDERMKNQISMLEGANNIFSYGLEAVGCDANSTDETEIKQAGEWVEKFNSNIKLFESVDPTRYLQNGEVSCAFMWEFNATSICAEDERYQIVQWEPENEGDCMSIAGFVIPEGSKNKEEAELFLNYISEPVVAADISNNTFFLTANKTAFEMTNESYRSNPVMKLPEEYLNKSFVVEERGEATTLINSLWAEIKSK